MKVLFLSTWYPSRFSGKNGNFIERQAVVVREWVDLCVLQVQYAGEKAPKVLQVERREDKGFAEWTVYYTCRDRLVWKYLFRSIAWVHGLQLIRRQWGKPDLIHAHVMLDAGVWAYLYSRLWKLPWLLSEHATLYQGKIAFLHRHLCRLLIGSAAFVLPVSEQLQMRLELLGKGRFRVVSNPVNTDLFRPGRGRKLGAKLRLLHVSTLKQESKNIAGLLRVIASLSCLSDRLCFTLAGDGNLKPWQDLAALLQIEDGFLQFRSEMSELEVAFCMEQHDVFVLFSFAENQPCVLLEAQACGMPVIATRVGGVPGIVPDERFGMLVEPGDEAALAQVIVEVLEKYDGFDRELIRSRALDNYSVPVFRQQIQSIYASCFT